MQILTGSVNYKCMDDEENECVCLNEESEMIPDSIRDASFFNELSISRSDYCDSRREMAQYGACAQLEKDGEDVNCRADGKFHPVQYRDSECYCVDEMGSEDLYWDGSEPKTFPEAAAEAAERFCVELLANRQENFKCLQERAQGHHFSNNLMSGVFVPLCQDNGHYYAIQSRGSVMYCANEQGEQFSSSEYGMGELEMMELIEICMGKREMAASSRCSSMRKMAVDMADSGDDMMVGGYVPECDVDGFYVPTQSKGSEFYCAEPMSGQELPETRHNRGDEFDCEREVTLLLGSDCYVERYEALADQEESRRVGVFIVECGLDGRYHHTQCHGSMCYCAESMTGRELEDSQVPRGGDVVAEEYCLERREMYEGSDCYQKTMAPSATPGEDRPECDDFGRYLSLQSMGSRYYCADKNGNELIETEGGVAGAQYCQELREIHDNSACYQAQSESEGFGNVVVCDVRTGVYFVTQIQGSIAYCVDQETGEKIEGTEHPVSEAGKCGSVEVPYVRCIELEEAGDEDVACNDEGMYFVQQCMGYSKSEEQNCICVDKWGDHVEGTERHHISEHACFEEERDDIRNSFSGSECEVERQISEALEGIGSYTEQCNDDGTFAKRQCTDSGRIGCFCLNHNGDHKLGSAHAKTEMRECGEVTFTFYAPKGDNAIEGSSASITCSVYASYVDETFEMLFDSARYEVRDMEIWGDVKVEESTENFANGTVRTTLSVHSSLSMEMDGARFACVSRKNEGSIIRDIMVFSGQFRQIY